MSHTKKCPVCSQMIEIQLKHGWWLLIPHKDQAARNCPGPSKTKWQTP